MKTSARDAQLDSVAFRRLAVWFLVSMSAAIVACDSGTSPADDDTTADAAQTFDSASWADAGSPDAEVDATPEQPVISSAQISGYGDSLQVRQGAGEVRLIVSGLNLSHITNATLGDLGTSIVGSSDTELMIDVDIAHGAERGFQDLTITSIGGSDTLTNAVAVTEIVASTTGSDSSGRGTPDTPFRTATKAVASSASGDFVLLQDGEYQAGETCPLEIPNGVELQGSSVSGTILLGSGGPDTTGLSGYPTVANLSVQGFDYCITGDSVLDHVAVSACGFGVYSYGDTISITDSSLSASKTGVSVHFCLTTTIVGTTITSEGSTDQPWNGIYADISTTYETHSIAVENTIISDSIDRISGRGVRVYGAFEGTATGDVSISSSTITASCAIMMENELSSLNMGTSASPGNNALTCGNLCYWDLRGERLAADGPIYSMFGTTFNGATLPAGVVTGPAFSEGNYVISNANNRVDF